jgi:hypothetical protein
MPGFYCWARHFFLKNCILNLLNSKWKWKETSTQHSTVSGFS